MRSRQIILFPCLLVVCAFAFADKQFDETMAKARAGDAASQYALGRMYYRGESTPKDLAQAVSWYSKSAEQGWPGAQSNLGSLYANGEGVPKDEKKAAEWFTKAANQGLAVAQHNLAIFYELGRGVNKDIVAAEHWYTKAAEQGYPAAQLNLGNLYMARRTTADYKKAFEWFTKAAEQGQVRAQTNLAYLYANGLGVNKDPKKAYVWSSVSRMGTQPQPSDPKEDASSYNLSPGQFEEARAEAAMLVKKIEQNKAAKK